MKILTAIKQVAGRDTPLRINPEATWIAEEDLEFEINEPDAYALEAALALKDRDGSEVIAVSAGPERAARAIREALAKGADRGIHVETGDGAPLDSLQVATLLARVAAGEAPDLVLTGLQSDDLGYGQTGVVLAELLGWPHATIIMEIEKTAAGLRVKRELEGGWFQYVELPLPAVLTVQSGISKLRYATLMGIKRARTKEIKRIAAAELGPAPAAGLRIARIYAPPPVKQTQFLEGSAAEVAAKLVEKLRTEARVL
jgi:electron transfer flavoprotein beta subunit